jgi:hypothetical protein
VATLCPVLFAHFSMCHKKRSEGLRPKNSRLRGPPSAHLWASSTARNQSKPLQLLLTPNGESVDPLPHPMQLRMVKAISVESFRLMHWIMRATPGSGERDGISYPHQRGRGLCAKTRLQIGRRLRLVKASLPMVDDWLDNSNAETDLLLR